MNFYLVDKSPKKEEKKQGQFFFICNYLEVASTSTRKSSLLWEERHIMSLVTITYNIGCDGESIGNQVAKHLGVDFYNNNRLQQMALDLGLTEIDLKEYDERAPGLLNRLLSSQPKSYLDIMEKIILQIAERGNGVIIGHGSPFLLRDFECSFHVKIHADPAERTKIIMAQQHLEKRAAQLLVNKMDSQQHSFLEYAFNFDVDDPGNYDLIINSKKLSTASITRIITDMLAIDELTECTWDAYQAMVRRALLKKIHNRMINDHIELSSLDIEIQEDHVVVISGACVSETDREKIPRIMNDIPEVTDYVLNVAVWSNPATG